jgi:hypothetical protein
MRRSSASQYGSNCERIVSEFLVSRESVCVCTLARLKSTGLRNEGSVFCSRYTFWAFDLSNLPPVLTVPGVVHVVCCRQEARTRYALRNAGPYRPGAVWVAAVKRYGKPPASSNALL